jgi:hypothetical protein
MASVILIVTTEGGEILEQIEIVNTKTPVEIGHDLVEIRFDYYELLASVRGS